MEIAMIDLDRVSLTSADFLPLRLRSSAIARPILSDLSLTLGAGQIIGIVGPTGAGKSSLLKLLNRLVDPSQGQLRWQGQAYAQVPVLQLRRQVMLVPSEPKLLDQTVAAAIVHGLQLQGQSAAQLATAIAQWQQRLQIPPEWLDKSASSLSLGQRQWVTIARGIACEPTVLLLDEPTSHLDQMYGERLRNVLCKLRQQTTPLIIVVSHDWRWLATVCDRVLQLKQGRLVRDELAIALDWQALAQSVQAATQAIEAEWQSLNSSDDMGGVEW
jgi:D-methionine transport system ATP-binding protein